VAEAEDGAEDYGSGPEAEGAGLLGCGEGTIEGGDAASEGELQISAEEGLFKERDERKPKAQTAA
jgi:hypothetical protein